MMRNIKTLTLADIEAFLTGSQELDFSVKSAEAYKFIEGVLGNQRYSKLTRNARGLVRRFLMKVTGLSRAQVTRLIERWKDYLQVRRKPAHRPNFPRTYTPEDIALLAEMDAAHEDLSGPAMRHLFVRANQVHHQTRLKIIEIKMKATREYSAAVQTEDKKLWVDHAPDRDRRGRAEKMIQMLMAGKAMELAIGSIDPWMNYRAVGDDAQMNFYRVTYIPEDEQVDVMARLRSEIETRLANVQSPIRRAADALATKLITCADTMPGDEVRAILKPFFESDDSGDSS